MKLLTPPIFCDECPAFALAILDDRFLCSECLLTAITQVQITFSEGKIQPLPVGLLLCGGNADEEVIAEIVKAMKRESSSPPPPGTAKNSPSKKAS